MARQGNSPLEPVNVHRPGVRDNSADSGSYPLVQHLVIRVFPPEPAPPRGRHAGGPVSGVSRRGRQPIAQLVTDMDSLVTEKRPAAGTAIGIQQVHRASAYDHPGHELSLACHEIFSLVTA